jgi:hypothetical protein
VKLRKIDLWITQKKRPFWTLVSQIRRAHLPNGAAQNALFGHWLFASKLFRNLLSESAEQRSKHCALNSQTLAALGATGIDDGAAPTGFHASTEAVNTSAANFGRLVSAFHGFFTSM